MKHTLTDTPAHIHVIMIQHCKALADGQTIADGEWSDKQVYLHWSQAESSVKVLCSQLDTFVAATDDYPRCAHTHQHTHPMQRSLSETPARVQVSRYIAIGCVESSTAAAATAAQAAKEVRLSFVAIKS